MSQESEKEGRQRRVRRGRRMLATTARRCPARAKTAVRQAAGAARHKSAAAAAASDNVKNFKIYRWDPNEKVGFGGQVGAAASLSRCLAYFAVVKT